MIKVPGTFRVLLRRFLDDYKHVAPYRQSQHVQEVLCEKLKSHAQELKHIQLVNSFPFAVKAELLRTRT